MGREVEPFQVGGPAPFAAGPTSIAAVGAGDRPWPPGALAHLTPATVPALGEVQEQSPALITRAPFEPRRRRLRQELYGRGDGHHLRDLVAVPIPTIALGRLLRGTRATVLQLVGAALALSGAALLGATSG